MYPKASFKHVEVQEVQSKGKKFESMRDRNQSMVRRIASSIAHQHEKAGYPALTAGEVDVVQDVVEKRLSQGRLSLQEVSKIAAMLRKLHSSEGPNLPQKVEGATLEQGEVTASATPLLPDPASTSRSFKGSSSAIMDKLEAQRGSYWSQLALLDLQRHRSEQQRQRSDRRGAVDRYRRELDHQSVYNQRCKDEAERQRQAEAARQAGELQELKRREQEEQHRKRMELLALAETCRRDNEALMQQKKQARELQRQSEAETLRKFRADIAAEQERQLREKQKMREEMHAFNVYNEQQKQLKAERAQAELAEERNREQQFKQRLKQKEIQRREEREKLWKAQEARALEISKIQQAFAREKPEEVEKRTVENIHSLYEKMQADDDLKLAKEAQLKQQSRENLARQLAQKQVEAEALERQREAQNACLRQEWLQIHARDVRQMKTRKLLLKALAQDQLQQIREKQQLPASMTLAEMQLNASLLRQLKQPPQAVSK